MLCTSKIHGNHLETSLITGNLVRIRVTSVEWNFDFALVDEREKNRMQKKSDELGALVSKLQLGDDEMSIKTYIYM